MVDLAFRNGILPRVYSRLQDGGTLYLYDGRRSCPVGFVADHGY